MKSRFFVFIAALVAASTLVVSAQDSETPATGSSKYAGVENCKMCHSEIHESWEKSSHAKSFEMLVNVGKDKDPACLPCHTTGYGKGGFVDEASTPELKGTTCESCHGPGADHNGDAEKIVKTPSAATCAACHQPFNIHSIPAE